MSRMYVPHAPTICPWPGDKRWVYSITFDEALADLHRFAIPILERHDVPGHLEVVVGHIGNVRQIGQSSFNGYRHMNADELKEMIARGWGVGNHTWSHELIQPRDVDREIRRARGVLAEAVGEPITVYCSAGDNSNMSDHVLDACRASGYLGAMSLTDALNRPDDEDLLWMNRTFLHDQAYGPFFSEFDPFRNIAHARHDRGWLIDYLHCPFEVPVHRNKDCSADQLQRRIETIVSEGGDDLWLARVEDAMDYRYVRRHARIESVDDGWRVSTESLPEGVRRRSVTLRLPEDVRKVTVDGDSVIVNRGLIDVDLNQPRVITPEPRR